MTGWDILLWIAEQVAFAAGAILVVSTAVGALVATVAVSIVDALDNSQGANS